MDGKVGLKKENDKNFGSFSVLEICITQKQNILLFFYYFSPFFFPSKSLSIHSLILFKYQAGVFISRSSGTLGTAPMWLLWTMPFLQCVNVFFFAYVAADNDYYEDQWWYSFSILMIPCFYVGLLGGAVYVHGYKRICADFACVDRREFALAATSVAESFGIVCADILSLFIQSCLYSINHITGAMVTCPIPGLGQ